LAPSSATTSPASAAKATSRQHRHAGKALGDAGHLQAGRWRGSIRHAARAIAASSDSDGSTVIRARLVVAQLIVG